MVTQIQSDKKLGKSPELGNLKNYLKFLNNEKSEELGQCISFEVYFGRKSKKLVLCSLPENQGFPGLRKVSKPTKNVLIDLKNYARKQENELLILTKELQKEQLNILKKE